VDIFTDVKFYLYTALAGVITVFASHHPVFHDPALWLLGVLGHAIGKSHGSSS
jgi:hypothetical protein